MTPQTSEIWQGAKSRVMGAANQGLCEETQIRQMVGGPDLADCSCQQGREARTRANSQESRACATVDIKSTPAHKQAPHNRILRDAADRDWQLVMSPKISLKQNQEQFLEMYHYLTQNGIPEVTLVRKGRVDAVRGRERAARG